MKSESEDDSSSGGISCLGRVAQTGVVGGARAARGNIFSKSCEVAAEGASALMEGVGKSVF